MKAGDEIRITGPAMSAFLGEEGTVLRVRADGALLWRPHLWGNDPLWIDPRCVELVTSQDQGMVSTTERRGEETKDEETKRGMT